METNAIANAIEAILFAANGPVSVDTLRKILPAETEHINEALRLLERARATSGVRLQRRGDETQMVTAAESAAYVETFLGIEVSGKLSPAALEALAIIAYRQPVTRVQVEAVRGVNSDGVIGTLLARGLIEEAGRLETVGHPILYRTTFQFLQQFGLSSAQELPPLRESIANAEDVEAGGASA